MLVCSTLRFWLSQEKLLPAGKNYAVVLNMPDEILSLAVVGSLSNFIVSRCNPGVAGNACTIFLIWQEKISETLERSYTYAH